MIRISELGGLQPETIVPNNYDLRTLLWFIIWCRWMSWNCQNRSIKKKISDEVEVANELKETYWTCW